MRRFDPAAALSLLLALVTFALPVAVGEAGGLGWTELRGPLFCVAAFVAAAGARLWRPRNDLAGGLLCAVGTLVGAFAPVMLLSAGLGLGSDAPGLWLFVAALLPLAWRALDVLGEAGGGRITALLVPGLFGVGVLYLWEVLVRGFQVPPVLLPPPSRIAEVFTSSAGVLWQDFQQTFLKSVLAGYAMGSLAGFVTAVLVDRSPFFQRGLLPLGSLVSAIPIVGIAPILVMWFGFDWQSKAAVIVVMTFFPMLVNTLAGLGSTGAIERDLMHSYAAGYGQTLLKLRLPSALPFLFNALKINSTLALIGGIVAEFFGTPIVGMGFRISTEVGRMNVDMVWATIAVAAVAGSAFYGVLALLERGLTFWHPSFRHRS